VRSLSRLRGRVGVGVPAQDSMMIKVTKLKPTPDLELRLDDATLGAMRLPRKIGLSNAASQGISR